jgi:hypothetical protein
MIAEMREGKVLDVQRRALGTELAAPVLAGATSLELEDVEAMDLSSARSPLLSIGFEIKGYTVDEAPDETIDELDDDDPPDAETGTVTLSSPLANGYDVDTRVLLYPRTVEQVALVELEDQPEPIPARIENDDLRDRLATATRDDATAETVMVAQVDDEWFVMAMMGEPAAGRSRAYAEGGVPLVTGTAAAPDVVCTVPIEIPTDEHRVIMWASGFLSADPGVEVELAFDDLGIDFPAGESPYPGGSGYFPLVKFIGDAGFTGPSFVAPALPLINLSPGAPVTLPNGLTTGGVSSKFLPTSIMPYNADPPTPGLHFFRLVAYILSGVGDASVENARFWATVI